MKNKPSHLTMLKVYAFSVRAIEKDAEIKPEDLCKRIQGRYGVTMTVKELLDMLDIDRKSVV